MVFTKKHSHVGWFLPAESAKPICDVQHGSKQDAVRTGCRFHDAQLHNIGLQDVVSSLPAVRTGSVVSLHSKY